MTIQQAAAALRAGKVTSGELTREARGRIAKLGTSLNAFITLMEEQAGRRALQLDEELASGHDRGPLHGIPVALKDIFSTRGTRTTCGARIFADHVPGYDAAVVEKLEAAGAVIVGKTNMHELAYGITSVNPHYGAVRNPWDRARMAGGSSGGSAAAVAAEMVFAAMGSDTGGSIRIPAAFCGTVGLKPTFGRVSRFGVLPLDFSLDHMGPLTRSVRDAALMLEAIAGHDPRDPSSSRQPVGRYLPGEQVSIRGVRVGVPENYYFENAGEEAAGAAESMARLGETLGAQLVPVRVPDVTELNAIARVILLAEASAILERDMARREDFGADVLALLDQGRLIPATDYINAQRLRRIKQQEFRAVWQRADCLLTPTTPTAAPRIGETATEVRGKTEDVRLTATRFVRALNVLGVPALSMPCGFSTEGLPLGLQIVGRPFEEALILRVGAALEDATEFHQRRPQL